MKTMITLFIFLLSFAGTGYAQSGIDLKETSHDFGKIAQGRPVTHDFELVNNTKKPLIIETVQATCGCTTPEWSQAPIPPGATTKIKVGFNAGEEGPFSKTITVSYNGSETKFLAIKGTVYPSPTTSAPLNTSLSIIK